jgi:hypothetical protein
MQRLVMILTVLLMINSSASAVEFTVRDLYASVLLASKIIQKNREGSWSASIHEEGYQTLKDTIKKIGEN